MSHLLKHLEYLFCFIKYLKYRRTPMEDDFKKIQQAGVNTIQALVQWMSDAKLIDQAQETHDRIEKMFSDVTDQSAVEFTKFQQIMEAIAKEKKEDVDTMTGRLAEALRAGVEAFKAQLEESKKK